MDPRMGVVPLADGTPFQSTLYDMTVVGQLGATRKLPYYILTGRGCLECDANLAVYIHSPSDGEMGIEGEQPRFKYPGREVFYEDSTLLYEGRMFYGDCAASYPNAAVWLERRPDESGKWRSTATVAQVTQDTLVVTTLESNPPTLAEVQGAVRRGTCRELPGLERASEP